MIPTEKELFDALEERIRKATELVSSQRERVATMNQLGSTYKLPGILLDTWARSLELLHWQRALILWSNADGSLDLRKLQPSPSQGRQPDLILESICAELRKQGDGCSVSNDEFRSVVRRVVGTRMGVDLDDA